MLWWWYQSLQWGSCMSSTVRLCAELQLTLSTPPSLDATNFSKFCNEETAATTMLQAG
jgi:hypothetical protein